MPKIRTNKKLDRFGKFFTIGVIMLLGGYMQVHWQANQQKRERPARVSNLQKALCSHCNGQGQIIFFMDSSVTRDCPVCYGAGSRTVKINPDSQQPCPSCFAMGRLYNRDTHHAETCPTCMGSGAILRMYIPPSNTNTPPTHTGEADDV